MTTTDDRPTLRPRGGRPVPYTLTAAGQAALDAWPANRIEHEPRQDGKNPCDGRGCKCQAHWDRRDAVAEESA